MSTQALPVPTLLGMPTVLRQEIRSFTGSSIDEYVRLNRDAITAHKITARGIRLRHARAHASRLSDKVIDVHWRMNKEFMSRQSPFRNDWTSTMHERLSFGVPTILREFLDATLWFIDWDHAENSETTMIGRTGIDYWPQWYPSPHPSICVGANPYWHDDVEFQWCYDKERFDAEFKRFYKKRMAPLFLGENGPTHFLTESVWAKFNPEKHTNDRTWVPKNFDDDSEFERFDKQRKFHRDQNPPSI